MNPSPVFPSFEGVGALNRLATSKDLMELQKRANEDSRRRRVDASWRGLTIRRAVGDAGEAIFGTMADLHGNAPRVSAWDLLTRNDRLRGFGVLLIVMAVGWWLLDD